MKDILLLMLLMVIMAGRLYDLVVDSAHGASSLHIAVETGIFLVATLLIVWLINDLRRQRRSLERLREELATHEQTGIPAPPELAETRHQLGTLIRQQFADWKLTDSEQSVGLLLLKGHSLREIAAVRDTREKTVRAQASANYRKAGVSCRHAASAWFIADFL